MNLRAYLASLERGGASRIAELLGISISYLSQLSTGAAAISPARCVAIEFATGGEVTRKDLRPDDWQSIWPELASAEAAVPAQAAPTTNSSATPAEDEAERDGGMRMPMHTERVK